MVNRKSQFIERFEGQGYAVVKAKTFMTNMRNGISPSKKGLHAEKVLTLSAVTQGAFDPEAWKDGIFDECPPADKRIHTSEFYMCRGNGNKMLVGTAVFSPEDHDDLVFPDTVIAAHIDSNIILLPYLFVAWKMPSVRKQIEVNARTTNGTYKINQTVLSNIELIVPPLEKQNEFVSFVEQSDKSKFTVGRRFKSQFIERFGGIDEQHIRPLSEVCTLITDGTHNPPKFVNEGIPFLLVSNITGDVITYDTTKFITEATYNELMKRTPVEIGDVLLSTVGSYGHPALVEDSTKFSFQRHIALLKPNKTLIGSRFLHTAILAPDAQRQIDELVQGVAQKTLNLSAIKKIHIPVPSMDAQAAFIRFVRQSDKSKLSVQNKLSAFRRLTYTILQFEGGLKNVQ